MHFFYDAQSCPAMVEFNGAVYSYVHNLQGDIVGIVDSAGSLVVEYKYDAWGKPTLVRTLTTAYEALAELNPFRYRGYVYDEETGLYYVSTRYCNLGICRWINSDDELADIGESIQGYNLFSYCHGNSVNASDSAGTWPKWLTGAWNVVSGTLQAAAGAALGVTLGWTGVGAVAAGFLMVNGAATTTQGIGQIVNDVTQSNVLREDNIVRTTAKSVGKAVGGQIGEKTMAILYDITAVVASVYAAKVNLESAMPRIIKSRVFSANNGYGFRVGSHVEMFYRNPNAAGGPGGTIFSYRGPLGRFRIDWTLHMDSTVIRRDTRRSYEKGTDYIGGI